MDDTVQRKDPIVSSRSCAAIAVVSCLSLVLTACALEPPISIGKKESMVGQGMVITVTNTSDEHLHDVAVDILSPTGEARQFTIPTLDPHESVNIGWLKLDGWPIPEGSEVSVSCKGYALAVSGKL